MRIQIRSLLASTSAALCLSSCALVHDGLEEAPSVTPKLPESLLVEVTANAGEDVLVELDESAATLAPEGTSTTTQPSSVADGADAAGVEARAELYASLQERLLAANVSGVELRHRYQHIPLMLMHVSTPEALEALAARPEVRRIHEDSKMYHQLAQSLPLIRQPAALAAGHAGAGTSVVVIDTGCDYMLPAFGSCSAPGAPGCKVAYAEDLAPSDGVRDDGDRHGTNVSAIVLGVAPSAKVIALDAFVGTGTNSSLVLKGVDWAIQNRTKYNIASINMSLGGLLPKSSSCGDDLYAVGIENARAAGILTAIASGNSAWSNALSSPACVPAAVSVGAVYASNFGERIYGSLCTDKLSQADQVTCFSNSSSFLTMLAPGARITAAGIPMSGTSQAAPHVAGAIAVLRAAFPRETVNETFARLVNSGPLLTDPRNKVAKRRLDLQAALASSGSSDKTGPTGSTAINANAEATRALAVTLAIAGSDPSGVSSMCVSNTNTCTSFLPFSTSLSWNLASGDGLKTVFVTLRDSVGNTTTVSDTIRLDTTAPTGGVLSARPSSKQIALSWTAASDAGGAVSYALYAAANSAPACAGQPLYTGTSTSFVHTGLLHASTYGYRLCAVDALGNVSTGTTVTARPVPETQPPTGSVVINGGALYAKTATVNLTLTASDASGIAGMCISEGTTCTAWAPFASSKSLTLTKTSGVSKISVWYKDVYENVTATPVSASITVDMVAPTLGSFGATVLGTQVALSWTAALDASGIDSYKLFWQTGTAAPASCGAGTLAYSGTGLGFTHGARPVGTYSYRLCAYDRAGNVSAGLTKTVTVR